MTYREVDRIYRNAERLGLTYLDRTDYLIGRGVNERDFNRYAIIRTARHAAWWGLVLAAVWVIGAILAGPWK